MIGMIIKLDDLADRLAKLLVQVAVALQTLTIAAQVVSRYFFSSPLVWAEELARYLLVLITFIGGTIALKGMQLASIDAAVNKLPPLLRKSVVTVGQLAMLLMMVLLTYYGARLALSTSALTQRSPAMGLPMYYVYSVIPIAGATMVLHQIVHIHGNWAGTLKAGERLTE